MGRTRRNWLMIRLACENIRLNWRHSVATMLAISAGFAAVSLFDGFMASMRSQMADGFVNRGMGGHLIIEKRGAGEKLAEDPWLYSISRDEQAFINAFVERDVRIKAALRSLALTGIV